MPVGMNDKTIYISSSYWLRLEHDSAIHYTQLL